MKKILTAAVTLGLCLCFASCAESGSVNFSPTENDKKIVMSVGESEVEYQEFRYYFLNNKRDMIGEGATSTDEQTEKILTLTENNVRSRHGLLLFAKEYGVSVTKDDKKAAEDYAKEYRTENFSSDEEYLLALEANYMTNDLFIKLQSESGLAYKVLEGMMENGEIATDDADIDAAFMSDEIVCLKEIFVKYDSASEKAEANRRAEEALSRLMNGEEFEALMGEYSDYSASSLPPEHGYYTMKYDVLDVIWENAVKLAEGEHSYVIESEYGFHIIKRYPKDYDYMEKKRTEIYENYTYSKFYEKFYPFAEALTVEYTEFGKALSLDEIR